MDLHTAVRGAEAQFGAEYLRDVALVPSQPVLIGLPSGLVDVGLANLMLHERTAIINCIAWRSLRGAPKVTRCCA